MPSAGLGSEPESATTRAETAGSAVALVAGSAPDAASSCHSETAAPALELRVPDPFELAVLEASEGEPVLAELFATELGATELGAARVGASADE
ncbi:MAG TPA: hypothetical protein VG963_22600, partial [Polyangiaceae bacterium]|nr:hypothetical protein [Polyangiaceae bacterium]